MAKLAFSLIFSGLKLNIKPGGMREGWIAKKKEISLGQNLIFKVFENENNGSCSMILGKQEGQFLFFFLLDFSRGK